MFSINTLVILQIFLFSHGHWLYCIKVKDFLSKRLILIFSNLISSRNQLDFAKHFITMIYLLFRASLFNVNDNRDLFLQLNNKRPITVLKKRCIEEKTIDVCARVKRSWSCWMCWLKIQSKNFCKNNRFCFWNIEQFNQAF